MRQPDVPEPGNRDRSPTAMQRPVVAVKRAESLEVVQAGPVAGGQDDGVNWFARSVGPTHAVVVENGEHGPAVGVAGAQGGAVAAVIDDGGAAIEPAADRGRVQARA